jgi:MFS family permease
MLATALVPIAESLGTGVAETGWLIAALYLTTAVAQPTLGRMVDLLGARRVFLATLGLVAAAGLCGQFASTLAGLVAVRILLGVGTSGGLSGGDADFARARRDNRIEAAALCIRRYDPFGLLDDGGRPRHRRAFGQRIRLAVDLHD